MSIIELFSIRSHPSARRGVLPQLALSVTLWRQRRVLGRLSPESLDDVGISPKAARDEAARPIWDVPANWRD